MLRARRLLGAVKVPQEAEVKAIISNLARRAAGDGKGFRGRGKELAATQQALEQALTDFVGALPPHVRHPLARTSSVFEDPPPQYGAEESPFANTPEFERYQQQRKDAAAGRPVAPPQEGDVVFGLEALLAPRWDKRDVIIDYGTATGAELDKLGLTSLPRLQVPTFYDLGNPEISTHAKILKERCTKWTPPTKEQILHFESRIGFLHEEDPKPQDSKVTLKVKLNKLPLSAEGQTAAMALAKQRYNPTTGILKLTCNNFIDRDLNKQHLKNTLWKLITEAEKLAKEDAQEKQ